MSGRRVVITGLGTVNPLGNSLDETWASILAGRSGIGPITAFDAAEYKTQIAGEVKNFDPVALFGRKDARRMDRVAQLAMAAAQEALEDADLGLSDDEKQEAGVVLGSGIGGIGTISDGFATLLDRGPGRVGPFTIPMMLPDTAPGLISINFGFRGPNMSIATACASSNNAIGEAAKMVSAGVSEIMVTGGCEAGILPITIAGFNAMGALSTRNDDPEAASRPFDADRDGFVPAEGAAVLILESLERARARGAHIYGEVLGYGTSADAFHISAPHENGEGAILAMRRALEMARLEPGSIGYINAHGTGTALNDTAETAALKEVFGEKAYDIPVSSTKSQHGHLLGATSAVEAVISIQAMAESMIPATVNLNRPDPECDLDYVPNAPRSQAFDIFMSNGFGFGGHNAVIIIGKYANGQ